MTTKPVLLVVDDEPTVLQAIERDVQREYGADYQIVCATSGSEALETLKQLKLRNEPVALLLIDQRMPQMTGVEFQEHAMELFPDAKRVLLTVSADGAAKTGGTCFPTWTVTVDVRVSDPLVPVMTTV